MHPSTGSISPGWWCKLFAYRDADWAATALAAAGSRRPTAALHLRVKASPGQTCRYCGCSHLNQIAIWAGTPTEWASRHRALVPMQRWSFDNIVFASRELRLSSEPRLTCGCSEVHANSEHELAPDNANFTLTGSQCAHMAQPEEV